MATIKAFTDLSQSKRLAKFLPIESADMCYVNDGTAIKIDANPYNVRKHMWKGEGVQLIPCWSFAALLDILPDKTCVYKKTYKDGRVKYHGIAEGIKELILKDDSVDACVAMIEKLNELQIL